MKFLIGDSRKTLPASPTPGIPNEPGVGPKKPDVERPYKDNLLDRMKRVEPDKARKYRQRSGQ